MLARLQSPVRRQHRRPSALARLFVSIGWLVGGALTTVVVAGEATGSAATIRFNRDVRSILTDHCFACHGADSATREAGLRLDVRDEAIEMSAIVPGEPDASEMIVRIGLADDDEMRMPPPSTKKHLTTEQKDTLRRWVNEGAHYEPHWAFIAPTRPTLPTVRRTDWVKNPIDAFILSRLEMSGLSPAHEADRRTLARRAALDVTGLPPRAEWVEAFVDDDKPGAYERYLDRLFEQPTWGEHRGRHWLDYARYADTHGIHFDNFRETWAYRDWVINAFNRNQPFDQFSIEQLAGDLMVYDANDPESLDRLIATGFNRCNMTTNEGGIIDEEYAVLYARDRVETTSAVWLGLTTGCAACHDHKFDPLTQRDFYSLAAFFNNTTQAVRDGNVSDTPPIVRVPPRTDRSRWLELQQIIPAAEAELVEMRKAAAATLAKRSIQPIDIVRSLKSSASLRSHAPLGEGAGDTVSVWTPEGLIPAGATTPITWDEGVTQAKAVSTTAKTRLSIPDVGDLAWDQPFTVAAWVYLPAGKPLTGAIVSRMDSAAALRGWDLFVHNGRLVAHLIDHWPQRAVKLISRSELPKGRWTHIAMQSDGSATPDSIELFVDGEPLLAPERQVHGQPIVTIHNEKPLWIGRREKDSGLVGVRINDLRFYDTAVGGRELVLIQHAGPAMAAAALPVKQRPEAGNASLNEWHLLTTNTSYGEQLNSLTQLRAEQSEIRARGTVAPIMNEKAEPAMAFLLHRGEYDQRLDPVIADVPKSILPLADQPKNRLGLARWLFEPAHPLTARVSVNRFWQEVFGTGLVSTSADFGLTGELPSHPELLDYLAVEFRESGWDVQSLFRLMLSSATYRQSAAATPEELAQDPANRLLARGPKFRMDGEMIRDTALWAGGLLVPQIGGPSVHPYQPEGIWEAVAMPNSNTHFYKQDDGPSLYRRSMYTFWKRAAPPASMELFNAPSREVCTIRRERTNTPLQALVVLNDPEFVEAARGLARQAIESVDTDAKRLDWMSKRLLARPLIGEEQLILAEALAGLRGSFAQDPDAASEFLSVSVSPSSSQSKAIPTVEEGGQAIEWASWTMIASELLNLDETLCK